MDRALFAVPQGFRRSKILPTLFAAFLLTIGILLGVAQIAKIHQAAQIAAPPGQLVNVGGHRLHIHCQGGSSSGQPTIVLEAGLGESSLTWASITPTLGATTRVCAYDRAGYGWSDPALHRLSALATVTDLYTLLQGAGEPGPYVLVGHSLGGVYARVFAQRYPEKTVGMVLLDPSHEEMTSRLPLDWQAAVRQANQQATTDLRVPALLADVGLAALFPQLVPVDPRLPPETQATLRARGGANGDSLRSLATEIEASERILAEVRAMQITVLGDLPLIVIKAGTNLSTTPPAGLSQFTPGYNLHAELAAQSSQGRLMVIESSTHYVHYDAPERVLAAITGLLQGVSPTKQGVVEPVLNHPSSPYACLPAQCQTTIRCSTDSATASVRFVTPSFDRILLT